MGIRMLGNGIIDVDCPKCGKSNSYYGGVSWGDCKRCNHEISIVTEWKKSGYPSAKGVKVEPLGLLNSPLRANILSNDVYVAGSFNKVTTGIKPLGGKYAGQMSPILGDNTVIDHHGHSIGRIDGNGYFNTSLF